jgi:hypothetical protein
MMQELEFYSTIFSELTAPELATIVGLELNRRGLVGILYFYPPASHEPGYAVSSLTPEMKQYAPNTCQQLHLFAAHASMSNDEDAWAV